MTSFFLFFDFDKTYTFFPLCIDNLKSLMSILYLYAAFLFLYFFQKIINSSHE